jgi:cytochrome c-type biogenesis protein CcsB
MDDVMLKLVVFLYLMGTATVLTALVVRRDFPRALLMWVLGIAAALHAGAIATRSAALGHIAVGTLPEALSLLAFVVVLVFLIVQRYASLLALGAVVLPLAFGLTLGAALGGAGAHPVPAALHSLWLPVHVLLAIVGDALFAIAFSASLLYLVQERRLKGRRGRGTFRHLPSLEALDRVSHRCLVWGLILLTLGIVTGIVWAHEVWGEPWLMDPKLLFTGAIWALYMVLLQGRMTAGWRGRWAAQLTVAGFAVLVLSFVGVNVLGLGSHGGMY